MKFLRMVATTFASAGALAAVLTAGYAAAGAGGAVAVAQPIPMPQYHWCPGDRWDPRWGNNWDAGNCHDDHHRDIDGPDHNRDFWG
jgi:hypothetical protein